MSKSLLQDQSYRCWRALFKLLYGNGFNTLLAFGLMLSLLEIWKFIWAIEDDERSTSNPTLLGMFIYSYFASLADTVFMIENEEEMENKDVSITTKKKIAIYGLAIAPAAAVGAGFFEALEEVIPTSLKQSLFFPVAIGTATLCAGLAMRGIYWTYANSLTSARFAALSLLKQVFTHKEYEKLRRGKKAKLIGKLILLTLSNLNDHSSDVLVFSVIGNSLARNIKSLEPYSAEVNTGSIISGGVVAFLLALLDLNLVGTEFLGKTLDKFNKKIGETEFLVAIINEEYDRSPVKTHRKPKAKIPCCSIFISRTLLTLNAGAYVAIAPTPITLFVEPYGPEVNYYYLKNAGLLLPLMAVFGVSSAWAAWLVYEDATYHLFTCNNKPALENTNDIEHQDETEKTDKKKIGSPRIAQNRYFRDWTATENDSKQYSSDDESSQALLDATEEELEELSPIDEASSVKAPEPDSDDERLEVLRKYFVGPSSNAQRFTP